MRISVQANCATEISFHAKAIYPDPYNDIDLDVYFRAPDGNEARVPAFWAGGHLWKALFAGSEGEYAFETRCSNTADAGLHGQAGTISVTHYRGANPLHVHGRLRVAPDRRHFEHADGTPFFWVGDTWWMGLSARLDWPHGFKALTADRVAKGFNVVQIIAGPYPDMDAWDPRGQNEAGFPFKKDFHGINPAYYDLADLKIGHLVHAGIVPCIVGMWGYYLPQIGVERIKRFWRYLVARYAAYPVVWCLCGEGTMAYYLSATPKEDAALQRQGWTEVMAFVRKTDGFHNLIAIHPTQYGRDQVEDPALMDFEMLQTGHGDLESVAPTAQTVITAAGREPRMPVVNAEVNYEGILGRCWQNIQRLCFYTSVLNGTAGHTYGANGIWQMSTKEQPYGPSPHGRCWGNTPWQEACHLPGSRQIGFGGRFMRRLPWWELERHPEWVEPAWQQSNPYTCTTAGIPGKLRVVYVPLLWDPPLVKSIEPGVTYQAFYFNPCTGDDIPLGPVNPAPDGTWRPPLPPEVHDWLLVMNAGRT
jgi:hypothetical protein